MEYNRPIVLSIAGLDPSGGAGLLADVKTVEQHRCLGFGVATAWTVQTENRFMSVYWLPLEDILAQLRPLLNQYPVAAVKIGIVQHLDVLRRIVDALPAGIPIVWDPVMTASAGGTLLLGIGRENLQGILERIYLVTPNLPESRVLGPVSAYCRVYLKGGHAATGKGTDILYHHGVILQRFPSGGALPAKHGSGCILSSAISAGLAMGLDIITACAQAKAYTEKALGSNTQLLAYHHV
ncbi:MAG TPA: hydroxymethylpyrimidine/phosphomethylpyrimidine kinase [Chitinophaga sp.]